MCLCRVEDFKTMTNSRTWQLIIIPTTLNGQTSAFFTPIFCSQRSRQAAQKSRSNKARGNKRSQHIRFKVDELSRKVSGTSSQSLFADLILHIENRIATRQLLRQITPFIFIHWCWFAMDKSQQYTIARTVQINSQWTHRISRNERKVIQK
jgi:hypothetical protein